jgi:hypothetical protein
MSRRKNSLLLNCFVREIWDSFEFPADGRRGAARDRGLFSYSCLKPHEPRKRLFYRNNRDPDPRPLTQH